MKNIHILPTDQPSRLHYYFELNKKYALSKEALNWRTASHIYITSDEEIQEGDWILYGANQIVKIEIQINKNSEHFKIYGIGARRRIILTTDPTLIADGVQSIEDDFLEWFVKNSSCDFVEVVKEGYKKNSMIDEATSYRYKIIIPQEEPKHACTCGVCNECEEQETVQILNEAKENALKQSTLEEAAEKRIPTGTHIWELTETRRCDFIAGAKWQAERMYSEEDMRKSFFQGWVTRERFDDQIPDIIYPKGLDYEEKQEYAFNLWFEQNKKK